MVDAWQGRLVKLRAFVPADAEAALRQMEDSRHDYLSSAVNYPQPVHLARNALAEGGGGGGGDEVRLAITRPEDRLIGWVGVFSADARDGSARVGVGITDAAERRKRYASDALCVLARHLLHERRYHRVEAHVYEFNAPSQGLFRSLGFAEEGRLREAHFADGRYWDVLVFGITAAEFDRIHPGYRLRWLE